MTGAEGFMAVCVVFIIFGLPVVLWFASRYMKHRERMAMFQAGMDPNGYTRYAPGPNAGPYAAPPPPYGAPPFGTPPYASPDAGSRSERKAARRAARQLRDCGDDKTPEGQVRGGVRTAAVGLALTIGLSFIGFDDGVMHMGPWLLGGLVPLFVGLSQIVNGVLSGADFPSLNRGQFYGGPPFEQPGPGAPGNGATGNGMPGPGATPGPPGAYSYTYRPGQTPEIDVPPRPPRTQ